MDNDFGTWQAWSNQYWPAKYLIDRSGHVRYYHFGEGEYAKTEEAIRTLLGADAPAASGLADDSPHGQVTPESYLGYERLARYSGARDRRRTPSAPTRSPRSSRTTSSRFAGRLEGRGRAGDRRPRCPAAPRLSRPQRLPRADGNRLGASARRRQARAHGEGQRATGSTRSSSARRAATTCWSCASPRASRATPSRSVSPGTHRRPRASAALPRRGSTGARRPRTRTTALSRAPRRPAAPLPPRGARHSPTTPAAGRRRTRRPPRPCRRPLPAAKRHEPPLRPRLRVRHPDRG